MHLRLAKSRRTDWLARTVYVLVARIDAAPHLRDIIRRHAISAERVYTDPRAFVIAERAEAAYQRQRKLSVWRQEDQLRIIWENLKATVGFARAALAFRVNIIHLLDGITIETRDLHHMIEIEATIADAFDGLKILVDHAGSFDDGREDLLTPDTGDDPPAHPSTWRPSTKG